MPFAAVAAAIPAAVSIGTAVLGSNNASDATTQAAQTQANAANQASATELQMFNQTQQNLAPFLGAGTNALTTLQQALGLVPGSTGGIGNAVLTTPFSAGQYQQSPGYQWQMQQGIDAIQNSAAARGGVNSGNTLKALQTYGQGLANSDYQQGYNNYVQQQNQLFNFLQTLAGSGQNAGANLGSLGSQVAGQVGGNIQAGANATAAGTIANAQNTNNLINSLTNSNFLNGITSGFGSLFSGGGAAPAFQTTTNGFAVGPV